MSCQQIGIFRVFREPRLIIALVLPGLLIYMMYSLMGGVVTNLASADADVPYRVAAVNMPAEIRTILDGYEFNATYQTLDGTLQSGADAQEKVKEGELELYVVFDADWADKIENGEKPAVTAYYNSSEPQSSAAFTKFQAALDSLRPFTMNSQIIVDGEQAVADIFSMLIPMLLITFLFSGCLSVAPESIAGEKERGTIATLLVTPVKRSHIAIGKITALSILAIISALSSFTGLMLSLPSMMGISGAANIYGFAEYALVLLVLISTVLLIIGVMAVISAFAKNVREANMLIMPFMIVSMLVGLSVMLTGGAVTGIGYYFIPLFNTAQALTSILTFQISAVNLIVTVLTNIAFVAVCVFGLAKMFSNEKIMFRK